MPLYIFLFLFFIFLSTIFQGHALPYESYRDKVAIQNRWHHCICYSANHNTGTQCLLWRRTSGGAELAGVHQIHVNYHTGAPYKVMLHSQDFKQWPQTFWWQVSVSSVCKDCSHTVLKRMICLVFNSLNKWKDVWQGKNVNAVCYCS